MRPPLPFAKPPAAPGKSAISAAIGSALPMPAGFRDIAAQQAKLRMGGLAGLQDALAAPPKPPEQIPLTDANGRPFPAPFLLELGLTVAALGNIKGAIRVLQRAVELDPALAAAWRKLATLHRLAGDQHGASAAAAALSALPPDAAPPGAGAQKPARPVASSVLQAAERQLGQKIEEGKADDAVNFLRQHLRANPTDVACMRLIAEIATANNRLIDAERLLERALELAPDYFPVRRDYATVLLTRNRAAPALPHLEWVVAREPNDPHHTMALAFCLSTTGDYDRAIALYESMAEDLFQQPGFLLNYAHCLVYVGRREDGVQAYRACLEVAPGSGEAWWGLANIKNEKFDAADIEAMNASLAGINMTAKDRIHAHYALGTALEQRGDYAASFSHYAKGAAAQRAELRYDPDETTRQMQQNKAFYTQERFAAAAGAGETDPAPIFILGMPRAGSTLIEQILASHSLVEGTRELPEITAIAREIGAHADPAPAFDCLTRADFARLGASYLERCRIYRKSDKPFFIDKMPSNWVQVGLIHHILPNARIIDARRHPMANCFSNFKQLFGSGAHYTYSLTDLGRFYNDYVDWMAHIDAVLPGRVHRVIYERLVDDMEGETRRLLAYCGLDFEPACLRYWESKRAVATPSSEQVRQPIYRDGLEQWRKFEPWLGPLQAALDKPPARNWDK